MDLLREYTRPQSSTYYQSPLGLYTALKERYGKERAPSLKQVREFLDKQKSHYLYTSRSHSKKKIKKEQSARWIIRSSIGVLQADIAYLTRFVMIHIYVCGNHFRYPSPFKYLLVVVETLSRYVWVRPLKQLTANNCRNAFEKIFKEDPVGKQIHSQIRRVVTDAGAEFKAGFDRFLKSQKIEHVFTTKASLNKAAFAELSIKHIKAFLGRAMADDRTNVVGKINNAVFAMNNSTHSRTRPPGIAASDLLTPPNMRSRSGAPTESCQELINDTILHYRRYQSDKSADTLSSGQKQRFKINDRVRIAIRDEASAFSKISDPQWSSESYIVTSLVYTLPILSYRLSLITPDNVRLQLPGSFSETVLKKDLSK